MRSRLEVRGLHKAYNSPVLVDFDFDLAPGEVHALVGGNGAGKSTFARILCGLAPADAGAILLDGAAFAPESRPAAARAGVVMVLQELGVLPTLTVAENLFFHALPHRAGWIDRDRLRTDATAALARVGLGHLDPDMPAGALGLGHQQMVEIAGALAQNCRVLILDEPTAALTGAETGELFRRVRELTAGGVGVIYISHRMDEIRRIAHRVTVLRDGRRISTHAVAETSSAELIAAMTGRVAAGRGRPERAGGALGPVRLEVRGLHVPPRLHDISFEVRGGEIHGLAGLVGSGRTELLRAIFGADPCAGGDIVVDGRVLRGHTPVQAVEAGLGMLPEDRKTQALLMPQSVRANASLSVLDRFVRRGLLARPPEAAAVADVAASLAVKCDGIEQPAGTLSGGNQQKTVLARWLLRDVGVFLLDEPTRGIDVAAKERIYALLDELAGRGCALLVVSSETEELMAICDRIGVLSAGRLVGTFPRPDWSEETLNKAAFSGYLDA